MYFKILDGEVESADFYSLVNDLINETNEQRGTIYYSRPGNFGKQTVYGVSVNGTFNLKKWWTLQLYTEAKNIDFNTKIYDQPVVKNRWYWYVGRTNQFKISKKLNAELGGNYQARILSGQFLTISVWQMRAGASYKILKDMGTIRLSISDMFYTNQPGGDIRNIANSKANWLSYLDSRVFTIGFSYRFNKGKSLQSRQSNSADAEKGWFKKKNARPPKPKFWRPNFFALNLLKNENQSQLAHHKLLASLSASHYSLLVFI